MRLRQDSPDRLVLSQTPWVMLFFMLGMGLVLGYAAVFWDPADGAWARWIVAGLGIALIWLAHWAFPLTRTVFDRPAGLVAHEERRITGTRVTAHPLAEVDRAQVRSERSESGGRVTRLVLVVGGEDIPLERSYGATDRRGFEDAINDWLTRPAP